MQSLTKQFLTRQQLRKQKQLRFSICYQKLKTRDNQK